MKPARMRMHSIQAEFAYLKLIKNGVLNVTDESLIDSDFLPAYKWLIKQMAKRVNNFSGHFPIWAWLRKGYNTNVKEWSANESLILLTVDVPVERVLLSNFEAWHFVLNNRFLSKNEEDFDKNFSQAEKEKSWELIFENGPSECGWSKIKQACIDQVFLNEIVSAKKIR